MAMSKRAVHTWSMWSLGLLLGALIAFLVVVLTTPTPYGLHGLPLTSDTEVDFLLLAAFLVAVSALVALGAVAAGTRGLDKRTRAVRRRSIDALICLLANVLIFVPAGLLDLGRGNKVPGGECAYDSTTCIGRPMQLGYGVFFLVFVPLLITYVICMIGAVAAGISRAAKSGKRGWFVAIPVYLIGSVIIAVWAIVTLAQAASQGLTMEPSSEVALSLLILTPFLTPVVTLLYSLVDREQSKSA
jgi:hypothetical protein